MVKKSQASKSDLEIELEIKAKAVLLTASLEETIKDFSESEKTDLYVGMIADFACMMDFSSKPWYPHFTEGALHYIREQRAKAKTKYVPDYQI